MVRKWGITEDAPVIFLSLSFVAFIFEITSCSSLLSLSVINTVTKSNPERAGFISSCTSQVIICLWEKSGQAPGGKNRSRDHGGMWFTGLLLTDCSDFFFSYRIQDHLPRWHCPQVGWALPSPINHQSRKCPRDLSIGWWKVDIFSTEVPSFQMALACIRLTKTNQYTSPDRRCSSGEVWFGDPA